MTKMHIKDVYRHWAASHKGIPVEDIISVTFSSSIGGGSPNIDDNNFSTFAGCEMWTADLQLAGGDPDYWRDGYIDLFDSNPVNLIWRFAQDNDIEIDFTEDPPPPPTPQELIERDIRK